MDKITPSALGQRGTTMDATGVYDWKTQRYQYNVCKWGTFNNTRQGTSSYIGAGTMPISDDTNMDSYQD